MGRHYTKAERQEALAKIEANGGDVYKTALEMEMPAQTLYRWRKRAETEQGPGIVAMIDIPAGPVAQALLDLQAEMIEEAQQQVRAIRKALKEAPISQRMTALEHLMEMVLKLQAARPTAAGPTATAAVMEDEEILIAYAKPGSEDDTTAGSTYRTADDS